MDVPEHLARTAMFTASEVESRTGVPANTLRQWERRYGFPRPVRNASGYRLYSPDDVIEIGRMQGHLSQGVAAGRAAELTLAGRDLPAVSGRSAAELSEALTDALLASDLGRAQALLRDASATLPDEVMLAQVISPSLVDIGERWARGEITVAHEHQASAFLRARLGALMDAADVSDPAEPLVVAACGPGEHHELGLMMLVLTLRRRGLRVAYVGADMPLGDLATYAGQRNAAAIVLAAQGDWALPGLREQGHALDGLRIPVFYGGALLNAAPELASALGGTYAGPDLDSAATLIEHHVRGRVAAQDHQEVT